MTTKLKNINQKPAEDPLVTISSQLAEIIEQLKKVNEQLENTAFSLQMIASPPLR
jgi:hypothetical protein